MRFVHNINIEAVFQTFRSQNIKLILISIDLELNSLFIRDSSSFECFKVISFSQSKVNCKYDYSRDALMIIEDIIEFSESVKLLNLRNSAWTSISFLAVIDENFENVRAN